MLNENPETTDTTARPTVCLMVTDIFLVHIYLWKDLCTGNTNDPILAYVIIIYISESENMVNFVPNNINGKQLANIITGRIIFNNLKYSHIVTKNRMLQK